MATAKETRDRAIRPPAVSIETMAKPSDLKDTAKSWQTMVDSNHALLQRKSGHDVSWWVERARAAGLKK